MRMTTDGVSAAAPVARLVEEFHKLPGIGPKTAQRLTYYLIRMPEEESRALAEAILAVKERIVLCSRCYNITESNPCAICDNANREQTSICVVEEALDVLALERTHSYKGLYHVLHGVISPMNGIGPDDLKIQPLLDRLKSGEVQEV
ncbi:MAG: recombination protein RecR, partial [Chloroflexi bacterium]|nr:recombination protein RecR [Chloroflexota bacterium]